MKLNVYLLCLVVFASGCTRVYQDQLCRVSPDYLQQNAESCAEQSELQFTRIGGLPWIAWPLLPVALVGLFALSNPPSSSPHYQAGGSAYKDYTLPQNQPIAAPTVNGGGKYGNYPKY